jgi:hypothetical protein
MTPTQYAVHFTDEQGKRKTIFVTLTKPAENAEEMVETLASLGYKATTPILLTIPE